MPPATIINVVSQQIRAGMADAYFLTGNDFSKENDFGLLGNFTRRISIRKHEENGYDVNLYCSGFEEKYCEKPLLFSIGLGPNQRNKFCQDSRSFAQTEARCNCLNAGHPYQNAVSYETLRLSVYSFNAILALDGKKVGESSYDEITKALENHFGFKLWKWFDGDDAYYVVLNKSTNETYPIPY